MAGRPGCVVIAGAGGIAAVGLATAGRSAQSTAGACVQRVAQPPRLAAGAVFRPGQLRLHEHGRVAAGLLSATGLGRAAQRVVAGIHDDFSGGGRPADAGAGATRYRPPPIAQHQPAGANHRLSGPDHCAAGISPPVGGLVRLRVRGVLCPEPAADPRPPSRPTPSGATGGVRARRRLFDQCDFAVADRLAA
ncbi:hypothetical protein PFLmoz3_04809 [Pseudomonas fluorescens]|uniref:Uncharacterized protein n=1 Tax=Pseudomonas fluorescens TaxID=294 RepID=A0A109LDK2_PSEFL|nr:hypothetical protein PFLmoz3_04809 [Pseudomonas fluorescens]